MKKIISLLVLIATCLLGYSTEPLWKTHFAYNSVQLITMDEEHAYALANGKMFSINQVSEQLTLYTNFSGLHGTEITQLAYDSVRDQLLILYADGKMDILHNKRMQYISDLYNKKMTSSKKCNNVSIHNDIAYLSMDFGILTFDLNLHEFIDTYYIGPEAKEVIVRDVMVYGDSIYARTDTATYAAHLGDNIVDFRYWHICSKLPKQFDSKKGKEYTSKNGDIWRAANEKGVSRKFITGEQTYYLPDGPKVNSPYSMKAHNGKLYVVPGGRWATQNNNPGHVMIYEKDQWINISQASIKNKTGKDVLDFMDVAIDPYDDTHFFVTSYGTGLYEFRNNDLHKHYTVKNSILGSAAPNSPDRYTRTSSAIFDDKKQLWVSVDGGVDTTLVCFLPDGTQHGLNCYTDNTTRFVFNTSGGMIIDALHPQQKWLLSCRSTPAVVLLNDGGTSFDANDDKCIARSEFYDQDGTIIAPEYYYTIAQAPNGDVWIGSSIGPIIIPHTTDFLTSNQCIRLRIIMPDGSNLLDTERINAFAWDNEENIWIGTHTGGVYVLNDEATKIIAHYTCDNSVMPANTVVSLAYENIDQQMFIGTSMGLVSITNIQSPNATSYTEKTDEEITYGNMYQWRSHSAFTEVEEVVVMGDKIFSTSSNSLFSVNKNSEEIEYYNKLKGLSSSNISQIAYNNQLERMLISYNNGMLDIMDKEGNIYNISDLYLKQMNTSKQANDICIYQDKAIMAMSFGILIVDMKKAEITDTYYIGEESSEVNISQVAINDNIIYATTNDKLYYANLEDNLVDYAYWNNRPLPTGKTIYSLRSYNNKLYSIVDQKLYVLTSNGWKNIASNYLLRRLCPTSNHLFALPYNKNGICEISNDHKITYPITYGYNYDIKEDNGSYWLGTKENGLVRYCETTANPSVQEFYPDGPSSNYAYRLKFYDDKLYMLPGGRWASEYKRPGDIMIYENGWWQNIKNKDLIKKANNHKIYDIMNIAQDPKDNKHYFFTTYGTGLIEMYDTNFVKLYLPENSKLFSAAPNSSKTYTRTDGAIYDDLGNLWLLNLGGGEGNIHVISPDGIWNSFDLHINGDRVILHTAGEILIDNLNPQWKWIPLLRSNTGLVLLQDNGTPTDHSDDKITYRSTWIDQNSKAVIPTNIYAIAQDHNHTLWVGTSSGMFAIPTNVDFTTSNECHRVVIPRNDGTNLGDYLLDNEQINTIAVDGANRLWVGTASSGVFLLEPVGDITNPITTGYTVETVAHFTTENSIMPSDEVLSIAIQESTGEVFIGTGGGLVSYMSDATEAKEDYSQIYAYPNPIHPNYHGYITIKGLMEDTEIRIVDASGNLVKTVQATGGSATWDGKNTHGQRVASGVYTCICNTKTGSAHGTVKILIMN